MLTVKGKVVASQTFQAKNKKGEMFDVHRAYIVNGGRPVEVRTLKAYKVGTDIDLSVWISCYKTKAGDVGFNLVESKNQ